MLAVSTSGPTSGAPAGAEAGPWCRVPNTQLGKFKFARSMSDRQVARVREGVFCGLCVEGVIEPTPFPARGVIERNRTPGDQGHRTKTQDFYVNLPPTQ